MVKELSATIETYDDGGMVSGEHTQVGRARSSTSKIHFSALVEFFHGSIQAEVLVQSPAPGELIERPSMRNFIRLYDPAWGKVVATADDVRELNDPAAVMANILGNTYPYTEMLIFCPDDQSQVKAFSRTMREHGGLFGTVDIVFEREQAGRTFPDGYWYDYDGTAWRQRPGLRSEGIPYRQDMQFGISRKPDYRIEADDVLQYTARDHADRALQFIEALREYSGGRIRPQMVKDLTDGSK